MTHRIPTPEPGGNVRSFADSEPFRHEHYLRDGSGTAYPGEPAGTGRSFWADFQAAGAGVAACGSGVEDVAGQVHPSGGGFLVGVGVTGDAFDLGRGGNSQHSAQGGDVLGVGGPPGLDLHGE